MGCMTGAGRFIGNDRGAAATGWQGLGTPARLAGLALAAGMLSVLVWGPPPLTVGDEGGTANIAAMEMADGFRLPVGAKVVGGGYSYAIFALPGGGTYYAWSLIGPQDAAKGLPLGAAVESGSAFRLPDGSVMPAGDFAWRG